MENKENELSFESNITKLETIVKELENGNVPLDDAINKFNEAVKLAAACDEKLKSAEDMVNKILNSDGTMTDFKVEE